MRCCQSRGVYQDVANDNSEMICNKIKLPYIPVEELCMSIAETKRFSRKSHRVLNLRVEDGI